MKSILREAEMLDIKDLKKINPDGSIDFFSFKKIISAQNLLLYGCYSLNYELGKKFAFYLFPYGLSFEDVVKEINELIKTDWKVEIIEKTEKFLTVKIKNCIFCSEIEKSCELFTGFLVYSFKKSLPDNRRIVYSEERRDIKDPNHHTYFLKLKWEKK